MIAPCPESHARLVGVWLRSGDPIEKKKKFSAATIGNCYELNYVPCVSGELLYRAKTTQVGNHCGCHVIVVVVCSSPL